MLADLKLLPKVACGKFVDIMNMVEDGVDWPEPMQIARAAFMAEEEGTDLDPLSYRVLLMLPSVYRLCATIRLTHMQPWIQTWTTPETSQE